MYGMVNRGIEQLVRKHHGDEAWDEIRRRAGVEAEVFISNGRYDDAITYNLVGSASEVLGVPATKILEDFGEHWVLVTAEEAYGLLLEGAGASLGEFLDNLPALHSRISLILPALEPPFFTVSERTESSLVLNYRSHRPGLQPFVVGLVKGLGKRFGVSVEVTLRAGREQGLDHDQFLVRWSQSDGPTP